MGNLNNSIYSLLGSTGNDYEEESGYMYAVALGDSQDGYVNVQIDDSTYTELYLEEYEEVEVFMDEELEDSLDTYDEEIDESEEEEEEDYDDTDNDDASDEEDEED